MKNSWGKQKLPILFSMWFKHLNIFHDECSVPLFTGSGDVSTWIHCCGMDVREYKINLSIVININTRQLWFFFSILYLLTPPPPRRIISLHGSYVYEDVISECWYAWYLCVEIVSVLHCKEDKHKYMYHRLWLMYLRHLFLDCFVEIHYM